MFCTIDLSMKGLVVHYESFLHWVVLCHSSVLKLCMAASQYKDGLSWYGDLHNKDKWSSDPLLVRQHLYTETEPWILHFTLDSLLTSLTLIFLKSTYLKNVQYSKFDIFYFDHFRVIHPRDPRGCLRPTAKRTEDVGHSLSAAPSPWEQRANQIKGADDLSCWLSSLCCLPDLLPAY